MKNTKSRKKMLMSSVAMLLVALIALGTATFAWFAANPDASAKGLSLKTTASAGLVVMSDTVKNINNTKWSHYTTLNAVASGGTDVDASGESKYEYNSSDTAVNLTPVSQKQDAPATFYTATAQTATAFGANATGASVATGGYYSEKVYCRLTDGADANSTDVKAQKVYVKGVTITKATGATMENCIRVAITSHTGTSGAEKLLGTYALSVDGANGVLTPVAGNFNPTLATTSTALDLDTGLTELSAASDNFDKYITVYVWLDGQDTACFSDNVGTENAKKIIQDVQIDLTLK